MIDVDLRGGQHKTAEYLAKNPFGQVPVLEDGDLVLADSNAILVYLAKRYDPSRRWLPEDPVDAARVQGWLSIAAGPLAAGPAAARRAIVFGAKLDIAQARTAADKLFRILDEHLASREFFVSPSPTIADVALYSYTAHAPEGGVSLDPYPHVRTWLARVEGLPGFVPMRQTPLQEGTLR